MTDQLGRLAEALADRYAIERELGAGGMATVYLAEDVRHHRNVAVKVLRPELAAVLGAERFVQEIETTARLQHPNILPLFDSGETAGFLYYVMPFIDGETLRDTLNRETQLSIEQAVKITTEVADALDYAHRSNVIHRDIKPENILLHEGRPIVADFGIALAISAAAGNRMTETGLSLGTPHYMSPEQATAEKDLTNRSDIYSLGCVLYEMLTGEPPHTGGSAQAIIAKIVTGETRPVTELRKTVPENVAAATAKSLQKLPADRFENGAKFVEALSNPAFTSPLLHAAAVTKHREGQRAKAWHAAITVLLAIMAVWGWLRPRPEIPEPVSRYRIVFPEGESWWVAGSTNQLGHAVSPDGSRFVYVGRGEQGTQLWVRRFDQLRATPLPGSHGAYGPFFSPEGSRVGYLVGRRPRLMVQSLAGGPPTQVADSGADWGSGSWGPDGFLYFDALGEGLARMPDSGGRIEPVTTPDLARGEGWHMEPRALPNGKGVLFTMVIAPNEAWIAVADLRTGTHKVLVRGAQATYAASGHLMYVTADGTLMAAPFDQDDLSLAGEPVALVDRVYVHPWSLGNLTMSNSGTLMYSTGPPPGALQRTNQLVWVARDGTPEVIDSTARGQFFHTALSPDGAHVAVTILANNESEVWVKRLDRGPLRLLTTEKRGWNVSWMADGLSVMFIESVEGLRTTGKLYSRRADGSGFAELVFDRGEPGIHSAFWSRDGEWLVYDAAYDAGDSIYALRPGLDNVPLALVQSPFRVVSSAALSPDGRWLAYVSDESGRNEVYVVPFPDVHDSMYQVSTGGGIAPVWARSGRELFYRSNQIGGVLMVAEVSVEDGFDVGERRMLFSVTDYNESYDVAPDDQRFIMLRGVNPRHASGELIVVENFFEELKAKVGN